MNYPIDIPLFLVIQDYRQASLSELQTFFAGIWLVIFTLKWIYFYILQFTQWSMNKIVLQFHKNPVEHLQ